MLMDALDADPTNPMTAPARYLDVTLDAARDALVAHRDPELWPMVGSGTGGWFSLELITLSRARIRYAHRCLDAIELPFPVIGYFVETSPRSAYSSRVDALVAASPILDKTARRNLRSAYRWGGFDSPSLAAIAGRFGKLVRLYLELREPEMRTVE